MNAISITKKRNYLENPEPSAISNKRARTDATHPPVIEPTQTTGNLIIGRSSTPSAFRSPIIPIFTRTIPSSNLPTSTVSQEEFNSLKEKVTQLEAKVSILENMLVRLTPHAPQPIPTLSQVVPAPNAIVTSSPPQSSPIHSQQVIPAPVTSPLLPIQSSHTTATQGNLDYINAQKQIAKRFQDQENYTEAIKVLSGIVLSGIPLSEFDKQHASIQLTIGNCYMKLNNYLNAIECYKVVPPHYRNFPYIQIDIGNCYVKQKDFVSAIKYFNKTLEVAGLDRVTFGTAQFNLGICYFKLGNYSTAITHFSTILPGHHLYEKAQINLNQCANFSK